jgi:phosphoribosylanthranilate isomerase
MRLYIKICGIRSRDMAEHVVAMGADAIGLVFYAPSPRFVTIEDAQSISAGLPNHIDRVALLVNASEAEIEEIVTHVNPTVLQFHGDEDAAFCERIATRFELRYWKAIRVNPTTDLLKCRVEFSSAEKLLLDADARGLYGGSGEVFDWSLIPSALRSEIILSGGLNAQNVASAIDKVQPWGIDVSSGVESSKGVKDKALITEFIRAARSQH